MKTLFMISYDIVDDKRRRRVQKVLEGFGARVQFSVFECLLAVSEYSSLKEKLAPVMDSACDSIRLYRLCKRCAAGIQQQGEGQIVEDRDFYIV